jgi:hypothetical protein
MKMRNSGSGKKQKNSEHYHLFDISSSYTEALQLFSVVVHQIAYLEGFLISSIIVTSITGNSVILNLAHP